MVERNLEKVKQEREPDKLVARGKAFAQMGDLTRAEQYFVSALEQGADADEVLPLLLRTCIESGRFRVAIDHARHGLKTHPNNSALRFLLGSLLQAVGEYREAIEQFERVVASNPEHADAHYALATIARDYLGDLMRADIHFREYLRLNPKGPYADEARNSLLQSVP
ncbi:MAG TPA: tetratricopeptide repeat protein [Polyangiaceae bacterium]|nr:tetratricopeptide repeat protein [Polyangiaceae bacterium]HQK20818.1 tetratricopeptide repeat protein [Polyangiaceae bacterium]